MRTQEEMRIGSEFVGYRLDELLGRGGMGVVYRAYDLRLKRTVALKLMAPELALDRRFRERFAREAELAMSLEHPNVVPIYDAGDVDGRLYLAMRRVEGSDLRALLRAEGALDAAASLAICRQVAKALDAAHARGLVHRDVKPSNVLLDAGKHVYLADFGLTRRFDEPGGAAHEHGPIGTPAYLAPEQIEGGQVDGRTDVYSLGCLLYECLTGEPPFARGSRLAVAWAHLEEEPPRVSERRPELPGGVDAVIRTAMAKDRDDRYPTGTALMTAAEDAFGLNRASVRFGRRPAFVAALVLLLVLGAAAVAAVIVRGTGGPRGAAPAVKADTLVRIDPATDAVSAVVDVGGRPAAAAVGGRSVWVYNSGGPSLSEIDAAGGALLSTTRLTAFPGEVGAFTGPVLAADDAGAWLVGDDVRGRPVLTRVLSGRLGERAYRLDGDPSAVAVGNGAVWVIVRTERDRRVERIDPVTGAITARTRFSSSSQIDGLAVGLGEVWVGASTTGMLYRVDPRSAALTGRIDLGRRSSRPEIVFGSVWVGLADRGGDTVIVDPSSFRVVEHLGCCAPGDASATGYGSIWMNDAPSGDVVRWDGVSHDVDANVHVADPPYYGGLCLTSITAGARGVWVTVANNVNYGC